MAVVRSSALPTYKKMTIAESAPGALGSASFSQSSDHCLATVAICSCLKLFVYRRAVMFGTSMRALREFMKDFMRFSVETATTLTYPVNSDWPSADLRGQLCLSHRLIFPLCFSIYKMLC